MESEQSISSEADQLPQLNTSIGPVTIEVGARNWFAVQTVSGPKMDLTIGREHGAPWEKPGKVTFIATKPRREFPASPELIDEMLTLTTAWADAHPEVFEEVAAGDFDDLVSYIIFDSFDQVRTTLKRIERDIAKVLQGDDYSSGELAFHAPPQLLELIENAVKMLHVWGVQAEATADAIHAAATAHTGRQVMAPGVRP
jgi:hypothetical protein